MEEDIEKKNRRTEDVVSIDKSEECECECDE